MSEAAAPTIAAMQFADTGPKLDDYTLDDRFARSEGRVFLTGSQALVAIMIMQRRLDRLAGLNTGGFVSGYRGSPLGGVDQALWRANKFLKAEDITFLPAINEDLAATAVLGTQQVELEAERTVDGVFSMWYGKGPGVDRAGDALKHGNAYGSSPHGGVLVVAGDDHGCASSSMSHQSDVAFMAWYMPTLNPASIAEYVEYGLYGFALSRFSGMWVGFKGVAGGFKALRAMDKNYRSLTPSDLRARAAAFGADYAVIYASTPWPDAALYEYGAYKVVRLAPPSK